MSIVDLRDKIERMSKSQHIELARILIREHHVTYDENQNDYMCDYLTLDGIYTYKAGNGCLFNARQMHCTNNWTKYKKFKYRELLQIHLGV